MSVLFARMRFIPAKRKGAVAAACPPPRCLFFFKKNNNKTSFNRSDQVTDWAVHSTQIVIIATVERGRGIYGAWIKSNDTELAFMQNQAIVYLHGRFGKFSQIVFFSHLLVRGEKMTFVAKNDFDTISVRRLVTIRFTFTCSRLTPHASRLHAWGQNSACSQNVNAWRVRREDVKRTERQSKPVLKSNGKPQRKPASVRTYIWWWIAYRRFWPGYKRLGRKKNPRIKLCFLIFLPRSYVKVQTRIEEKQNV